MFEEDLKITNVEAEVYSCLFKIPQAQLEIGRHFDLLELGLLCLLELLCSLLLLLEIDVGLMEGENGESNEG